MHTRTSFFNIIAGSLLCASCALMYVHQEVEMVKTGFHINKNRQSLTLLLDQYKSLVYNLSRLESPGTIEDALSLNDIRLCMPAVNNVHHFVRGNIVLSDGSAATEGKKSFLANLFDRFPAKAEAKDKF